MGKSCYFMAACQSILTYNGNVKISENKYKIILDFQLLNITLTQPELQMKLIGQQVPEYTTNINQLNINVIDSLIQWNIQSINDKGEKVVKTIFLSKTGDLKYIFSCFDKVGNLWKCKIDLESTQPLDIHSIFEIPNNETIYSTLTFTN